MMDQMPHFNHFASVPDFILTWRLLRGTHAGRRLRRS
jgi:hypothetical protein